MAVGDPKIFRKKVESVEANTAVAVLLDLSGSMSDKYKVANAAAFSLHTTLFGLKGVAVCSLEFSEKENGLSPVSFPELEAYTLCRVSSSNQRPIGLLVDA